MNGTLIEGTSLFLCKFSSDNQLLYSSYYFQNSESVFSDPEIIVFDQYLIISSSTQCSNLPVIGQHSMPYNNSMDIYIAKISISDGSIIMSGYIGGENDDRISSLSKHNDQIIVASNSYSSDIVDKNNVTICMNDNAEQTILVLTLRSSDFLINNGVFIGGSDKDEIQDCSVLEDGSVLMVGGTLSSNFPITGSLLDPSSQNDCFLSIISIDLSTMIFSIKFGGIDNDIITCVEIDSSGNIFFAGESYSGDFPVSIDVYSMQKISSQWDIFLGKLTSDFKIDFISYVIG